MKKFALFLALIFTLSMSAFIFQADIVVYAEEVTEETQPIDTTNDDTASVSSSGGGSNGETWNPLEVVNGVPKLAHAVDYSQNPNLLKYLKKGDLIYEPEAGWSITGHTALVVDIAYDATYQQEYVLVVEAVPNGGVCYGVLTPNRFNTLKDIIKRVKTATQAQINSAVSWACNQVGKSYFVSTSKSPDPDNEFWYCSELVWAAFYWQGIYLDQNDNEASGGSVVMPHEINADADLTTIMQHGKTTVATSNNTSTHTITCNNETFTENHKYITYNSSQVICAVCDYIHSHSYTIYRSCGDGVNHRKFCGCGASSGLESCFGIALNGISTCKKCGQKITGFIPTITSTDDEKKNKKG